MVLVGCRGVNFDLIIEAAKLGKDSTRTCTHPSVCDIFIIHAPLVRWSSGLLDYPSESATVTTTLKVRTSSNRC